MDVPAFPYYSFLWGKFVGFGNKSNIFIVFYWPNTDRCFFDPHLHLHDMDRQNAIEHGSSQNTPQDPCPSMSRTGHKLIGGES